MQRLIAPKNNNCSSKNFLHKPSILSSEKEINTKYQFKNEKPKGPINLLNSANLTNQMKKFNAPMPMCKSTTYDKKFKSIISRKEDALKSVKVNLFKNGNLGRDNLMSKSNVLSTSRTNKFKNVSTSINVSSSLHFKGNLNRERSRSINSSRIGTSVKPHMMKSTPAEDSMISDLNASLLMERDEPQETFNMTINEIDGGKNLSKNQDEYVSYMRKEEEVCINLGELESQMDSKPYMTIEEKVVIEEKNESFDDYIDVNLIQNTKQNAYLKDNNNNVNELSYNNYNDKYHKEPNNQNISECSSELTNYTGYEKLRNDNLCLIEMNSIHTIKQENEQSLTNKLRYSNQNFSCLYSNKNFEQSFLELGNTNLEALLSSHNSLSQSVQNTIQNSQRLNSDLHSKFNSSLTNRLNPLNLKKIDLFPSFDPNFIQENINKINLGLFSANYENLKTNKESVAKFSKEDYRKVLSTFLRFEYGKNILDDLFSQEEIIERFLERHQITERMRMRMVDWMIEVLSNYKCEDNTFFLAVNIMDRYFKLTDDCFKPDQLHLIGIVSMFIASKFYDVYPIKLKLLVDKVGHNKFTPDQIKETEEKIVKTLNYDILKPTSFEFINYYLEEIFYFIENNFLVSDDTLCDYFKHLFTSCGIDVKFDFFFYEKSRITKNFTFNMLNLLKNVIIYLTKMNCFDYNLISIKPSLLAASSILVAMKICEQINTISYVNDYFTKKLCEISKLREFDILFYAQKILYNAQNFDTCFVGLDNLKKIHFNQILNMKETK